ncbi:hypothetical protein ABZY16_26520 [Streptomyces sp. NPDC006553]|uniref:hypothetical protein n=1 Tax=Streptomyces sp. NPDC006553 TaxID=3157180 RepID=UPI0033B62DD9
MLDHTDWAVLEHTYGPAQVTPVPLVQLLDEDPEIQAEALGMLDMSVLHQESLYSATAPAALYGATVLTDPRTMTLHDDYTAWDERPRTLRAALLERLGMIADSAAYNETSGEDDGNDPQDSDAVRAVSGVIYDAVLPPPPGRRPPRSERPPLAPPPHSSSPPAWPTGCCRGVAAFLATLTRNSQGAPVSTSARPRATASRRR